MTSDSSGNKRPFSDMESAREDTEPPSSTAALDATQFIEYVKEEKIPKSTANFVLVSSTWYSSFLKGSQDAVYLAKGYAGEKVDPDVFNLISSRYGLEKQKISFRIASFSDLNRPFEVRELDASSSLAEELHLEEGSDVWALPVFSAFLDKRVEQTREPRILDPKMPLKDIEINENDSLVVMTPSMDPLGRVGLVNLGNTCFMNSSLQALLHIPELIEYFASGDFFKDLNPENPIGCQGQIAEAFGQLLRQMYDKNQRMQAIRPMDFLRTVGKFHRSFASRIQQDSQEFTAFLLDSLHEDLNRVLFKPSTEKPELPDGAVVTEASVRNLAHSRWDIHKKRNDSKIMSLFTGMYKSTLVCPECEKISITFDPFFDLTLPLPTESIWLKRITFVPCISSGNAALPVTTLEIALRPTSTIGEMNVQVADLFALNSDNLLVAGDVYGSKFFRLLKDSDTVADTIDTDDVILVYELPGDENLAHVPVYLRQNNSGFAIPFFISLAENEASLASIQAQVERGLSAVLEAHADGSSSLKSSIEEVHAFCGSTDELVYGYGGSRLQSLGSCRSNHRSDREPGDELESMGDTGENDEQEEPFTDLRPEQPEHERIENLPTPASSPSAGPYSPSMSSATSSSTSSSVSPLSSAESLASLAMQSGAHDEPKDASQGDEGLQRILKQASLRNIVLVVDLSSDPVYDSHNFASFENPIAVEAKTVLEEHNNTTLDDCLKRFSQPEVLGDQDLWYCPRCKEFRKAQKQLELWRTPDILMVHLKRFSGFHNTSRKITDVVEFPLEGLNLADYVSTEALGSDGNENTGYVYDLFAVDNHWGVMGGGHYTSFVKDPFTGEWLDFNDSFVSNTSADKICTEAAYLLFYKKRTSPVDSKQYVEKLSSDLRSGSLQKRWDEQVQARKPRFTLPGISSLPQINDVGPVQLPPLQLDSIQPASSDLGESLFKGEGRVLGTSKPSNPSEKDDRIV